MSTLSGSVIYLCVFIYRNMIRLDNKQKTLGNILKEENYFH